MNNDHVYKLKQGRVPLLISMPHVGTAIPEDQRARYEPRALQTEDTDWHLERLYGGLAEQLGASMLVPHWSRFLIDLNRPPEDTPMYPGASNTELCPTRFFTGEPLYLPGREPDAAEKLRRRETYWRPYHEALQAELDRLKREHGYVLLFDAHSIKSELPWLFEGRLPALNLGTVDGRSCDPAITAVLGALLAAQDRYSHVVNGRFKGGYITRHYGRPDLQQHAVQLEMCWRCYMGEAAPYDYDEALAVGVQPLLARMFETLLAWRPA
ncbi:N-formylglutamate deformylase [Roseateles violae]|uniref:N-formylglutamate deformylase n=1 Tax=Roseateles violae TaxID=3058042 RepID=A0ABT8DWR8_9BURK|nr:N-formylglutamate deformylase [Pelomonas sp. PFR6]MDN3920819.1 N-formylglutamate deformylase [Pelomonas sp. PFR6]